MKVAIFFTNFGPYHLARLRAAAIALAKRGVELIAYETASAERLYPWTAGRGVETFRWVTLFPGQVVEDLSGGDCALAMEEALDRDRPDVLAIVGYVRPEALAAARWANRTGRAAILLSESQEIDRPRQWWKEAVKRWRVGLFRAALVGGPSHQDYLAALGMPRERIAFGYNAVDNVAYSARAQAARRSTEPHPELPNAPYFLSVCRFAPEKNVVGLVEAYADYRRRDQDETAWDLVLCGDGPEAPRIDLAIQNSGFASSIHRPGFLQAEELAPWYAFASTFVLASRCEPWGLVVNEAAACGLPLLVSDRAGCSQTLVLDPPGTTGLRFDPNDARSLATSLRWMATRTEAQRQAMGRKAQEVVAEWGPERFASGLIEAIELTGVRLDPPERLARAS